MSDEKTEELKPWFVICGINWGRGKTPVEAARNAEVGTTYKQGSVYFADQAYVDGNINPQEFFSCSWRWNEAMKEHVEKANWDYIHLIRDHIVTHAVGKLRIRKGKLECLSTVE